MTRLICSMLLALMFLASTGCAIYSEDRATYHSTYMEPKSHFVTDVQTGDTIWTFDIPPSHILMVEFDVGSGTLESLRQESGYPTTMEWALYHETAGRSLLRKQHFRGTPVESGIFELQGRPIVHGITIGAPISPEEVAPPPRTIEEIQQDLPEPDAPEVDVEDEVEDAVDDAADAVEEMLEE